MGCQSCGMENPAGARFCNGCGTPLATGCARCGHANPPGSRFCNACGGPLQEVRPAATVTAPAPNAPPPTPATSYPTPNTYTPRHLAEKILASRSAVEGERKQVTVLFADIKGSTELIHGRDTEDAQRLLDGAIVVMMEAVHRYEGTVSRLMGDGLMALFGAPISHEDHAVRACFAALTLQEGMRRYTRDVFTREGLQIDARVGLNSGEVVVRLISDDLHMDYTAMGQTVHLASRLEQLAREGAALLSAETMALAEGYVQVRALGRAPIRGLAEPVEVFELLGSGMARSRLQVAVARGLTEFVGREDELGVLHGALDRAAAGQGQVVALVGDAGVGKSRLVWELTHSHRTTGWTILESSSISYGKATTYLPVIDLLKRYCRIDAQDDSRAVREKLTGKLLALDRALEPTLPALLSLLDASTEEAAWAALDPAQRRRQTIEALSRLLLRESQEQRLLLVFEDLHWIDSETQALLDLLIERLPTAQIMLLVNYRPEYQPVWRDRSYFSELRIEPLPPESADALLGPLLGDAPEVQPLRRLLIERTEGNPFFLEESVRSLVEDGTLVGERGTYRLPGSLAAIRVPPTVQAVLAARIDRLSAGEKRLLQSAAVVGNHVPFTLLRAVADLPDDELRHGLARLQAADFLYERSLFPDLEYTFKHALTHDVAYGALLHERRRALHARIVDAIEVLAGDRVAEQVDRLAHHAVLGEVWPKALAYLRQAYARAMARSAQREAVTYADQALMALEHLPRSSETVEMAIELRFQLRHALWALGDLSRIRDVLAEAERLAESSGDRRRQGWAALYLCTLFYGFAEHDRAVAAGENALALGTEADDELLQILAHINLGQAHAARTDFERAVELSSRAVALLRGERQNDRLGQGMVPSVLALGNLARSLIELGRLDEGIAAGAEAARIAEEVEHLGSVAVSGWYAGWPYVRRGDFARAIPLLERCVSLCAELGLPTYAHWGAPALGAAYVLAGRADEAIAVLEARIEVDLATGLVSQHSLSVVQLGEALLVAGREEEALARATEALALSRQRNERGYQAYALRLYGEIMSRLDPSGAEAGRSYEQALALANELGMRPLAAHCHRGLGMLGRSAGTLEQAREHLTAARDLYRELGMGLWLDRASAELAEVSP
jgi:class 3 adenylate cyclase/tetratricopeptide (TPR) repeat protein